MRLIIMLVACIALGLPAWARAQEPLTRVSLDDALQLALKQNPTVRAKEFELQAVSANEITAGLRPNPTMNFLVEQIHLSGTTPQYTVNIGQPIELGGKRRRRIESAKAATEVTSRQLLDVRRQTILQVKMAFANALIAGSALALAEQNLKTLDDTERLQRIRVEKGDLSELDLLRIQVQRFTFERDAADALQALAAAKIALRRVAGATRIAESFDIVGELSFKPIPLDRTDLFRRALDNRPDLRAADADRKRAEADHRLARANAWWDITPQVEYQRIGPDNTAGFGLSLPVRIFDRNQGEIARTQAEIQRVAAVREAVALQVLSDVDTDLQGALTQRARVVSLQDIYLPKATQARDTVEFAYRRGGVSLLDFLDAQRSYRETALAHLKALGAYLSVLYQLESDIGQPLE
jgi:cobalt-zinc-cadmium efflux system outer membrane protein